ncbi:MAG: signal recognition particle-docking protein FtsY [Haliea sp.]|jgi:fused signal recognition particle receptor|nr:signal recognition particle-docking protein FtsY [Haliea sp.]
MKFFKRKKAVDAEQAPTPGDSAPDETPVTDEQVASPAPEPEVETTAVAPEPADMPGTDEKTPESAELSGTDKKTSEPAAVAGESSGFFQRLRHGLGRTSDNLVQGLGTLFLGRKEIDAELLEELESRLLLADVGVDATMEIIDHLTRRVSRKELTRPEALQAALKEELLALLKPCEQPLAVQGHKPYVILMVGVNGVGKTTTIGKLARRYMGEGRSVMLAAGDTFRAAAVEQLQVWGERNNVPVVAQHTGADSASVIFDALQAAQARGIDVLIADTAGRLHNKDNLMEELKKVVRVMGKLDDSAPHEVMLVLDAGTGQNALAQAAQFQQWVGVSGLTLTKLDGTAKGGVIFAIARKLGLPIRFIGVGEAAEDLRPFEAGEFIEALFAGNDSTA